MRTRRIPIIFCVLCLFCVASAPLHAQDDPAFEAGVKPYGSSGGGNIDTVDLMSGNLTVDLPLMSYPQRGGKLNLNFSLHWQSGPATVVDSCDGEGDCWTYWGVINHGPALSENNGYGISFYVGPVDGYLGLAAETLEGAMHQFGPTTNTNLQNATPTAPWRALDGSGFVLNWNQSTYVPTLTDANGISFAGPFAAFGVPSDLFDDFFVPGGSEPDFTPEFPTSTSDPNGNHITASISSGHITSWTDSMSRNIPVPVSDTPSAGDPNKDPNACPVVGGSQPSVSQSWVWDFPGVSGQNAGYYPVKICMTQIPESYTYYDPNATDGDDFPTTPTYYAPEIQSIVLPNGTAWIFSYDLTGPGDLLQITYPTGGTISYSWVSNLDLDYTCGNATTECYGDSVATRTVSGGTTSGEWKYGYTNSGGSSPTYYATTVTDAANNDTVHTFSPLAPMSPYETAAQFYSGTSGSRSLMKTVSTAYQYKTPFGVNFPLSGYAVGVFPTQITTTWAATNQVSKVAYTYDSALKFYFPVYCFSTPGDPCSTNGSFGGGSSTWTDSFGSPLTQSDYDYGNGSPGSLLRTTTSVFEYTQNSNYLTNNLLKLPYSSQIKNGSGTQVAYSFINYDETGGGNYALCSLGTCGNPTSVHAWLNDATTATTNCNISVSSGYLVSYKTYNQDGTLATSVDNCGSSVTDANHTTTYGYSTSSCPSAGGGAYAGSGPTCTTNLLGQTSYYAYDANTGLQTSAQDSNDFANGKTTSTTYDFMMRRSQVSYPDGGLTTYCYTDEPSSMGGACPESGSPEVIVTDKIASGINKTETAVLDGLGRVKQKQLNSDPSGTDYIDYTYDPMDRAYSVSNPYRSTSDPTYGVSETLYDLFGRKCLSVPPDTTPPSGYACPATQPTNTVATTYSGNSTTVTDEAGKTRKSATNALGWLTDVWEDPSNLDYHTAYTYDALGDLLSVAQSGTHNRTFTYDSLKHLMQSTNPEAGSVCYGTLSGSTCLNNGYDADGNLVKKTDARSITATYSYDYLNRITGRSYSNGDPSPSYTYGTTAGTSCPGGAVSYNIDRRISMTDAGGSETFAYGPMGRVCTETRTTNSVPMTTTYGYNYDGSLATLVYPSGRTITYTPNAAGQPISAVDSTDGINYATGATYAPQDALSSLRQGSNLVSTLFYNTRLQPCRIAAQASGTSPASCSDSNTGNILDLSYNFALGVADNGDVNSITNNRDNNRSQTFHYDDLNRLTSGYTTGTYSTDPTMCWGETFYYDGATATNTGAFGNLTSVGAYSSPYAGCGQDSLSVGINTNNQITATGLTYDSDGNVLTDGANTYAWNGESEQKTADGVNYVYDGDGNRLYKAPSGTPDKIYWYGAGTEILDESDGSGNVTAEYVFFGGKRIAMDTVSSGSIASTYYYAEDFLGSSRTMVQAGATSACFDADFLPFGREKDAVATCTQNDYKFEGKERDAETGNDDFGARYYSSNFGRWLSPDWSAIPAPVPYANLNNPQTLNLYAMVQDNPESFADLDGHQSNGTGIGPQNTCNLANAINCSEETNALIFDLAWQHLQPVQLAQKMLFIITIEGLQGASQQSVLKDIRPYLTGKKGNQGSLVVSPVLSELQFPTIEMTPQQLKDLAKQALQFAGYSVIGLATDGVGDALVGVGASTAADAAEGTVTEGTQLYRVFGGDAKGLGQYYTTVNPATVADFRTTAGLFPGNSGQFVLEGTLKDTEGVIFRSAAPGPGGVGGGLPEVFVPNPSLQLNITRVSGVNPEF